jgi:NADPH2:quinone reductase
MTLPAGQRVVVRELAEDPRDAIDRCLALEDQPAPDPATLGPRDVIIEVRSASVNWVDLIMASGQYQHLLQPPYTPGLEYAGVVAWAGPEVTHVAAGDAVLVDGLLAGPRSLGAYQRWGGWASWAVAPAEAVHPIPGGLGFDQAATLLASSETAYHALVTRGRVQPGETVLVLGASGATGLAAVQVGRLLGATVIATGRSAEKLAVVTAHGAHHVIATPALDDAGQRALREHVKALTGGKGVDVVHDGVGGDLSLAALRCTRFGARYLIVGWASTPLVAAGKGGRGAPNANLLPTNLIMMKGLDVLGSPAAISIAHDPSLRPPRFRQVWAWATAGHLVPHVSQRFEISQFREAMNARWSSGVVGNAVITLPRHTP